MWLLYVLVCYFRQLWYAISSDNAKTWSTPIPMLGCRGVRHDPKGVWPQLLMLSNGVLTLTTGKETPLLRHFYTKCIILPRQARDKHRENSKKEWRFA